jgi:dipeptidyl aminopeptidase/acylaminoacyl peptidase
MLYFDIEGQGGQSGNVIYRADFENRDVLPLFDPAPEDGNYSNPAWSPDGAWAAFRVRADELGPGDQIWITPPDGLYALVVTDEEGYIHSDIAWDAWGEQLLYKRIQLGVSFPGQEVWVWDQAEGRARQLVEDAVLPGWLP